MRDLRPARWELPLGQNARPPLEDVADAESQLYALLRDAVKRRMVADVPVGAFLSGGLDSSLVVALMAASHPEPVKTFSIGFDTGFSEASFAADVAGRLHTDHHEVLVGAPDLIGNVPRVMEARETPITEASDIPSTCCPAWPGRGHRRPSGKARTRSSRIPEVTLLRAWGQSAASSPPGAADLAGALPFGLRRSQLALEAMAEDEALERQAAWFGAFLPREREALVSPSSRREACRTRWWLPGSRGDASLRRGGAVPGLAFWLPRTSARIAHDDGPLAGAACPS
jgi:hypothetical protein